MTFILHHLSHYNSITEPSARLLLTFIKDLTINFSSHFILFLKNVYRDTATRDKLIFPSAITRIIRRSSIPYPEFSHFIVMGALAQRLFDKARPIFDRSGHRPRWRRWIQPLPFHPPLLPLLRVVVWHLRPSWHSLRTWMLALIHSLLSCIKWTPMLVVLHDDKLIWVLRHVSISLSFSRCFWGRGCWWWFWWWCWWWWGRGC